MRRLLLTFSAMLLLLAMAVPVSAKTISGTDISPNQAGPITGTCYTLDANFAPSGISGSACYGNMGSDGGVKMRTNQDGNRVVFEVIAPYVVTKFTLEAYSNNTDATITATKVEVDGVEKSFTGGSFPSKTTAQNLNESGNLTVSGISATESIVIYFDNSEVTGNNTENTGNKNKQICAYYELEWQKDVEETLSPLSEMYDDQSTATGWATSVAGDNPRFTPVILNDDGNYYLSVDQTTRNNNGCVVTGTILSGLVAAGDDFTLVFDMRLGNNNQGGVNVKFMDATNKDIMLSISAVSSGNDTSWAVNGSDTQVTLPNSYYNKDDTGGAIKNITWCTYQLSRSGNITYLTIINKDTGATILERTKLTNTSLTGGLGNIVFTTGRYYANFAIDNIVLRKLQEGDVPEGQTASYTIQYHNETGAKIKDDLILSDLVGNEVEATEAQMAYIDIDDKRYLYKEGNQTITIDTDEAKNVITLVFREAAVCQYSVIAKLGDSQKLVASGSSLEQSEIVYYYPEFILEGKSLYGTTPNSTNPHFGGQMTLNESNKTLYIDYTLLSQNAVYCSEAEDINGLTPQSGNNADMRCSYGRGGTLDSSEPVALTTLPAGKYTIFGQVWGSSGYTATITDGAKDLWSLSTVGSRSSSTATITLTETTTLYFSNTYGESNKGMLDCIYIIDLADEIISFVDPNVKAICVANWDTDGDGELSTMEAAAVTVLGEVFRGNETITSFKELQYFIGLTSISNNAFRNCSALASIIIPDNVSEIGSYVFRDCTALEDITIPTSVTKIGGSAFYNCSGLTGTITIPKGVTTINSWTFRGCTNLKGVTLPNTVTSIGEAAFCYCSSMTDFEIPSSVNSIGNRAFWYCYELKTITIPESVKMIDYYTFRECRSLESVVIPSTVTSIERYAFYDCTNLKNVTLPASVTSIGASTFSGCESLTEITIPASVTSIGQLAFDRCNSLESVTSLIAKPFTVSYLVSNIEYVLLYVPTGTVDAYKAIDGWKKFMKITEIGADIAWADGDVFRSKTEEEVWLKFKVISAADKTCQVGDGQYSAAPSGIKTLTIPATANGFTVTAVGTKAFYDCTLTGITLPNTITTIGDEAFYNCNNLTSITFPSAITTIGSQAFFNASRLCNVTSLIEEPLVLNESTFGTCDGVLYVPGEAIEKYKVAEEWKNFKTITAIGSEPEFVDGSIFIADNGDGVSMSFKIISVADRTCQVGDDNISAIPNSFKGTLTIPSSVNGYRIIGLGQSSFTNCSDLTSVTIPSSVTSIGDNAFNGCNNLTIVTTENATPISNIAYKFSNRTNSILIVPEGSKEAYATADYWKDFKEILEGNAYQGVVINGICYDLFDDGFKATVIRNATSDYSGSVTIPECVTYEGNTYNVTSIGTAAFYNCSSLTSVTIPTSVTEIGSSTFYGCNTLITVTIPNSVTSIGYGAFEDCLNLTSFTIPSRVTEIGSSTFSGCSDFTSITIPSGVTKIGNYAFHGCSRLTSIDIPSSVTTIGYSAFRDCSALTSITIPSGVTEIGSSTFYGCSALTTVTIPSSVTEIGSNAFYNCSSLASVEIPNGVTTIGYGAFRGCSSLTSITIPSSVISIVGYYNWYGFVQSDNPFGGCSNLTTITVESGNTVYDSRESCNAIIQKSDNTLIVGCKSTIIPSSVTSIGIGAFQSCSGLTSVTIPNSVTSIRLYAFNGCSNLTTVIVENPTPTTISSSTFSRKKAMLIVPKGSKEAYQAADYWKEFAYIEEPVTKKQWDFTQGLSTETIANLNADADNWESNGTDAEGNTNNWKNVINQGNYGYWKANGENIEELYGLRFDIGSYTSNSIHLATTKLRLTRANTVITFPRLKNGQTITIKGKSANKTATDRGLEPVQDYLQFQASESSPQTDGKCMFLGQNVEGSEVDYTFVWKVVTESTDDVDVQFLLTGGGVDFKYFMIDNGDESDCILGDVNGNGGVDIGDAVSIVNYLVGKESTTFVEKAADTNKNGQIDIGDAVTIVNFLVGKTPSLSRTIDNVWDEREPQ